MTIVYLGVEDVIRIHDSEEHSGVRDRNALESAVEAPKSGFGYQEHYESLIEKAAALMRGLAQGHPFVDGNKRCAWLSAVVFLQLNGVSIVADQKIAAEFVEITVVINRGSVAEIANFLNQHQVLS